MAARHGPGTIPAEQRAAAKELVRRGTSYAEVARLTGVSPGTCTTLRREIEREGAGAPVAPSPGRRHLPVPRRAPAPVDSKVQNRFWTLQSEEGVLGAPAPLEALDTPLQVGQEGGRHPRETPGGGASPAVASETPPARQPALATPPPVVDGSLGEDFAVLAEQERDVTLLVAAAKAQENYVAMERLTRTRIELRRGMAQLRPPPPVDPEADLANTEAARVLVARLRKMIKARQERALQ